MQYKYQMKGEKIMGFSLEATAKRIASIFAENEATVSEMNEVFRLTKNYLKVQFDKPLQFSHDINLPNHAYENHVIGDE